MPTATEEWGRHQPRGMAALGIGLTRHRIVRGALRRYVGNVIARAQPCFDVVVDGLKLRCLAQDNATEWGLVFTGARQDRRGRDTIFADLKPGDVFVDIGANCGAFTLFAARLLGPRGRVIAIEPMPQMVERLRFNVAANGFDNVEIFATAVGVSAGTSTLYVDETRRGMSSMSPVAGYTPTTVPTVTLHSLLEAAKVVRIDALKIDIEGYEDRVLLPFVATAPRALWPERIFMETTWSNRWEQDCVANLVAKGYEQAWISGGDVLLRLRVAA
jgi:FkbM family methyltransferase